MIDPDSRLTQLGLLPVGAEDRYHLFESRAYGGESDRTLPELAAHWAQETFGVADAAPYVAVGQASGLSTAPTSPSAWGWAKIPPSASPIPSNPSCWRCSPRACLW